MARIAIGIGIEKPSGTPPEVTHILKKIGLATNATIEHVRAVIQIPETFAALGTTDLAILAKHFNEPIEARDDAVVGSKLDGVSNSVRGEVMAIQAKAFLKSGMRRPANPRKTLLIEQLNESGTAAEAERAQIEKSHADRVTRLIEGLQRLNS